jgi:phage tail sheath gpL-like
MEGGRFTAITQITPSWYDKIYASYKDDAKLQDIMRSKLVDAAQSLNFIYSRSD